jgi:general L-amino acid transport system permease protein
MVQKASSPPTVKKSSQRLHQRSLLWQGLFLIGLIALVSQGIHQAAINLEAQGIASGFDFLKRTAGFDIIQHLVSYNEKSTYGDAFIVALLNTLLVAVLGIGGGALLGILIGLCAFSGNLFIRGMGRCYIELIRNIPLLLQLFFWYFGVLRSLPPPRESIVLGPGIFLNLRGLYLPYFSFAEGSWSVPQLEGFNFTGGITVLPELVALVVTLSLYSAAFIGEIIRGGIASVSRGQWEASLALGLSHWQTIRLVVFPQALPTILPPLTSQFLNTTKNTSLAAAIAYPDLVLVFAGTVLMQTGQAVEVMTLTLIVYLGLSFFISLCMAVVQRRLIKHQEVF